MEIDYRTIKLLHLLGVALFLGNLVVTAAWKTLADRTREPRIVAFAQRLVTLTDYVFTGPGALLVLATGIHMARTFDERFWRVGWIAVGLGLFVISGLIWAFVLIPVQRQQARMARAFADGGEIPEGYWRLERLWKLAGTLATSLPVINLYFMVLRPF